MPSSTATTLFSDAVRTTELGVSALLLLLASAGRRTLRTFVLPDSMVASSTSMSCVSSGLGLVLAAACSLQALHRAIIVGFRVFWATSRPPATKLVPHLLDHFPDFPLPGSGDATHRRYRRFCHSEPGCCFFCSGLRASGCRHLAAIRNRILRDLMTRVEFPTQDGRCLTKGIFLNPDDDVADVLPELPQDRSSSDREEEGLEDILGKS